MSARTRTCLLVGLAATAGLGVLLANAADALLILAQLSPAILLVGVLLLGRYPGETRLIERVPDRHTRRSTCSRSALRSSVVRLARGGGLIGMALAGRAPPPALCIA